MSEPQRTDGISRRTVAKGLAWSVPAVAVATSAPAFAASGPGPILNFISACKNPGSSCKTRVKGYSFFYNICNESNDTIWIHAVTITSDGTDLAFAYAVPKLPIEIAPGQCVPVEFVASSQNSANQTFDATISLTWNHSSDPDGDTTPHTPVTDTVTVPGTPPDCVCPPA